MAYVQRMPNGQRGPLREHIAAEVRAWMARKAVTGEGLAAELGVSRAWVSRRLQAETALDADDLEAIADVLGVPVATLLRYPLEAVSAGVDAPVPATLSARRQRRAATSRRPLAANAEKSS